MNPLHKKYCLILLVMGFPIFSSHATSSHGVLQYDIHYLNEKIDPCLHVSFTAHSDASGEFLIRLPRGSEKFTFFIPPENILNKKALPFESTSDPFVKKIKIIPHGRFTLDYQFCSKNPYNNIDLPVLKKDFFVFRIGDVLVLPEDDVKNVWKINLKMEKVPSKFTLLSSLTSFNERLFLLEKNILDFSRSVVTGGENILFKKIQIGKAPIQLVSEGASHSIDNKSTEDYLREIISVQRTFWQDDNFENYLVVLLETQSQKNSATINGRHHLNAFLMEIPQCEKKNSPYIFWALSHELFHAWLGGKIAVGPYLKELQWFVEGFNDYYGLLFALKSGVISYSDYVRIYNDLIRSYYLNPLSQIPNIDIVHHYGKDHQYSLLAQFRGHFLAKILSQHQPHLLDKIMKQIEIEYRKNSDPFLKRSHIDKVFAKYLDPSLQEYVKKVVDEGRLFDFSDKMLGISSKLIQREVEVPDFRFDLKALFETQTIRGLKEDSAAFKAGLREGQKVRGNNVSLGYPNFETTFLIEEEGKIRPIVFQPDITKKKIPQYIILSERS